MQLIYWTFKLKENYNYIYISNQTEQLFLGVACGHGLVGAHKCTLQPALARISVLLDDFFGELRHQLHGFAWIATAEELNVGEDAGQADLGSGK
jgi:hypothetical protein